MRDHISHWSSVLGLLENEVLSLLRLEGLVLAAPGMTFHTVRVSHARSPVAPADRDNFMEGDDLSSIDVDGRYVYVVGGQARRISGQPQTPRIALRHSEGTLP